MAEMNKMGFIPIEIKFRQSSLPKILTVAGDYASRGYAVTFFNAADEQIKYTETQWARLYAYAPKVSKDPFYTEGVHQGNQWLLEIPSETLIRKGHIIVQIALYEGEDQLIQTQPTVVIIGDSLLNGGALSKSQRLDIEALQNFVVAAEEDLRKASEATKLIEEFDQEIDDRIRRIVADEGGGDTLPGYAEWKKEIEDQLEDIQPIPLDEIERMF